MNSALAEPAAQATVQVTNANRPSGLLAFLIYGGVDMPNPAEYDNEKEFMAVCVPKMMGEGHEQEQATAACMQMWKDKKSLDDELVRYGDVIFATKTETGVKFGGYLVRFGDRDNPDLTGDYFTKNTDFGDLESADVWLNHRFPIRAGKKYIQYGERLGKASLKVDDYGVFAEVLIEARNEYEKAIIAAGMSGKLGWSSGTAAHLVDRKEIGDGITEITRWPLGLDASLTPTPAEPRNSVVSLKSLIASQAAEPQGVIDQTKVKVIDSKLEGKKMADEVNKPANIELTKDELNEMLATASDQAVKKFADSLPETKAGFSVVEDEADRASKGNPFKGGEFWMAVKNAAIYPQELDKRLLPLKATGLNEAIPSQGGFLVPPEYSSQIFDKMHAVGQVLSFFRPIPVSGNNLIIPAVTETSRADGSRMGGILGYWMAEGGTKTASKPAFETVDIKLNKVAALVVATDELLQDASALGGWITNKVPEELKFQVESAIVKGDGVGKPLGITNSGSLVSATRTDASEVDNADIGRMWAQRWQGANDYIWLIAPNVVPQLLAMTIGNMPAYMPPGGLSQAPYGTLMGRPVLENEYSPSLGTLGDIMLIAPSQYQCISKASGVESASSIHVYFTADETAFRFVYRFGGQPMWRTTLTPYSSSDAVSPFVALAAST